MIDSSAAAPALRRAWTYAAFLLLTAWPGLGTPARAQPAPPVARADSIHVELAPPMAILVDLVANDSSPRGEPLRVVIERGPEVGALVPQWDGSFVYRLAADDPLDGRSRVTAAYRVEDAGGRPSETVEVCIGECVFLNIVFPRPDFFTAEREHTTSLPVLANDDGDGLELLSCDATLGTSGTVGTDPGGTCSYTGNQVGSDSFEYTVTDVYGNVASETVTVDVVDSGAEVMGVVGRITGLTGVKRVIDFGAQFGVHFDNPVVIAQPITLNGGNSATLEITEVQGGRFTARVANSPPALPDHFQGEDVSYVVVEGGSWEISPGVWLDAGVFETDATFFGPGDFTPRGPRLVLLPETYPAGVRPLVLTQLQTNAAGSWSQARLVDLSEERFHVTLQRGEEDQGARVPHPARERVGWLAVTRGPGTWGGRTFAAGEILCAGNDHPMACHLAFPVSFPAPPNLLAQIVTLADPEPAFLRYDALTAGGVNLWLIETHAADDVDGGHGSEGFGYLVVEGDGGLTATPANRPPTAQDQFLEAPQDEILRIFAVGSDPEGDTLRFGGTVELEGPGRVFPEVFGFIQNYEPPLGFSGTVTVRYSVQDQFADFGLESHNVATATIVVRPLVAEIAPAECFGATCTFDASPSSPEAVSFDWAVQNGVTGETTTYTGERITHTFSSGGSHTATLIVTNAAGSQAFDVEPVSIPPTAGLAVSCTPERVCSFSPSGTSADAVSFSWSFGDAATSSAREPTHVYAAGGRYVVTLTVGNSAGLEDTVAVLLDLPPTAAFAIECAGRSCSFTPAGTSADAVSFSWDLGDGTTSAEREPNHVYAAGGRYTVRLTVGNTVGLEDTAVQTLDLPPTAVFTLACDRGLCDFDATGSSSDAELFLWEFGDGATGTGAVVSHQYPVVAGTFTARLTVENGVGLTATATETVEIEIPDDLFLLLYVLD